MKKILTAAILLLFIFTACSEDVEIKNFDLSTAKVKELTNIIKSSEGAYFYPKFSSDNSKVFFSTVDYSGIYYFDLQKKSINNLIDSKGTGLNYIEDNGDIYFVLPAMNERTNRRIFSVAKQNILSKKIEIIYKSNFGIKSLAKNDNLLSFFINDTVKFYDTANKVFLQNRDVYDAEVYSFNRDELLIYKDGKLEKMKLFDNSSITNVQKVDPKNLLIEIAGKGVYKFSLETRDIEFLTNEIIMINVLENSNLAVGMKQKSNGLSETKSELYLLDINSKKIINLTADKNITALNPSFNKDGSEIVFNSMEGDIYLMSLQISEGQALWKN